MMWSEQLWLFTDWVCETCGWIGPENALERFWDSRRGKELFCPKCGSKNLSQPFSPAPYKWPTDRLTSQSLACAEEQLKFFTDWVCQDCGWKGLESTLATKDFGKCGLGRVCPKCESEDVFPEDTPGDEPPPRPQYAEDDELDFG